MRDILKAVLRCRRAATAVEYGLIVSLIIIAMMGALKLTASATVDLWGNVSAAVSNAH